MSSTQSNRTKCVKAQDLNETMKKKKTDNRNRSMGNSDKGVIREIIMNLKLVMITMLRELKWESFGRELETIKKFK